MGFPISIQRLVYPVKTTIIKITSKKYGYINLILSKDKSSQVFYISPNDTEWAATYYRGPDKDKEVKAHIRKVLLGHNYDVKANANLVQAIQSGIHINEYWLLKNYSEKNSGSRRYY